MTYYVTRRKAQREFVTVISEDKYERLLTYLQEHDLEEMLATESLQEAQAAKKILQTNPGISVFQTGQPDG